MRLLHLPVLLLLSATAACGKQAFDLECEQNTNCDLAGGGMCLDPGTGHHWCAYPDQGCPGGYRYSDVQVGDGVSGTCVPETKADAGVDAPIGGDTTCKLRVAFVDGPPTTFQSATSGHREVWAANPDGSGLVNLSNSADADDAEPSWAPSGVRVAFSSNRTGKWDIFVVNVDGTGLTNLTDSPDVPYDATRPIWSPDGTRIAFVTQGAVWTMNANGTGAARTSSRLQTNDLAWSPDNRKLVFGSATPSTPSLYVVEVGTGVPEVKLNAGGSFEAGASWAPATKITFGNGLNIFTVNGDGTGLLNVTQSTDSRNTGAAVSDDGRTIVFTSTRGGYSELWSTAATGGAATQVTHNTITLGGDQAQDVSPDGQLVAYIRTITTVNGSVETTKSQLGVIRLDGTAERLFNAPNQTNATSAQFSTCP